MVPLASGPAWRQTWSFTCMSRGPLLVGTLGQVDVLELERLLVELLGLALAGPLPGPDVGEAIVLAERLALGRLGFLSEVAAARLLAVEGVSDHELAELEEVGHPAGPL